MTTLTRFEGIDAWNKSRNLVRQVYLVSKAAPFSRDFSLRDQIRRCSVWVMASIAEGFGRRSKKEFANYLNIAHGSAAELQSHLCLALDLDYIDQVVFNQLYLECDEISEMV